MVNNTVDFADETPSELILAVADSRIQQPLTSLNVNIILHIINVGVAVHLEWDS